MSIFCFRRAAAFKNFSSKTAVTRSFASTASRRLLVRDASVAQFKEHVLKTKDKLILVDFYEDWCAPCKVLSPILEKLEADPSALSHNAQPFDLVTLKAESVPELAQEFQIRAFPSVFAMKNGSVVGSFIGALSLEQIKQWYVNLKLPEKPE